MITLIVKDGRNKTYKYKRKLKKEDFCYDREKKCWQKKLSEDNKDDLKKYKKLMNKLELTLDIKTPNFSRNSTYRNKYFKKHPHGVIGNYYQCAYCGKLIKKENLTIDHLFPIKRVEKGRMKKFWRFFLKLKGITNINQVDNLVGACFKCNSEKGTKIGKWYVKGCVGRHFIYWVFVWIIKLSFAFSAIQMIYHSLT